MKRKSSYVLTLAIIVLFILVGSFTNIIDFITDYKWFSELGYTGTFLTKLKSQFLIGVPTFLVVFVLIMVYLMSIKKNYYKLSHIVPDKNGEKRLNKLLAVVAVLISIFTSSTFAGKLWFTILQYKNSTMFNINDPIFSKDISFYIFKLPLLSEIISLLILLMFILIVVTVAFYFLMITIRRPATENSNVFDFTDFADQKEKYKGVGRKIFNTALVQVSIIGLVIFIIFGLNYILKSYYLVYSPRGVAFGASYTDVHVALGLNRIMAVIAILSAFGFLFGTLKKNMKIALAGPAILVAVAILGNVAIGAIQKFIVEPDEVSKEQKYLEYNIEFTQKAYGIADVEEKRFPVSQELTKESIMNNEETIKNIRINDYTPVEQVYNQIQAIRSYYRFNDVDIDRYNIDGKYTQVFLSARELDQKKLNAQAKTWINQHLRYTHGYGFTLSPVNSVTTEGQPKLLVKNIPPVTDINLKIERPEIYFGEITNNYIVVNTDEKEFDYPKGDDNQDTIYQGTAGIELSGINKLLFAIKNGNLKLLISSNINSDSRIIMYRNVLERVRKIAPFIEYDDDPYLVVNQEDGKLYWIIDGYTMTSRYPYSEPYKNIGVNYIRNSVKVTIDAYNGDVKYYVFDENDPIIMTYKKIFKDLFIDKEQMPKAIREHTRYPQKIFDIQSDIYRIYHMDNPRVFYNKEDAWDIAKEKYLGEIQTVESNYSMFKLPGEEKAEFLLSVPYTPATKPNMISLLVARNDGENLGKLFIYKFPKSKNIPGPMTMESKIDQDSNISPQLTLWSQKGSNVLRGNMMTIPIEDSLIYVEPIYLQADNENGLPEVKRVIVGYKDKIVMEETLDLALSKIFGQMDVEEDNNGVVDDVDTDITDQSMEQLILKANELFNNAREASQNGDWAKYGEYINELEQILAQLNRSIVPQEMEQQIEE